MPNFFDPIAVVGQGCFVPDAANMPEFLANLDAGACAIRAASPREWRIDPSLFYDAERGKADRISNITGGWLSDQDLDLEGYQLPATQLARFDNLQKWPLQACREALETAGLRGNTAALQRCGIILGAYTWSVTRSVSSLVGPDYDRLMEPALREVLEGYPIDWDRLRPDRGPIDPLNGAIAGTTASTLARALGLAGPRYAIDAACASIVYCMKLAAFHLKHGHADSMLVAAVSASDPVFASLGFSTLQALPTDRSRPFDAKSDGLAVAEGAVALVLKPLSLAERAGDEILGIIRGIGLSSDGKGQHIVTPNRIGQLAACERAYEEAGIDPKSVDYVECHATGTALGDRSEVDVIATFFTGPTPPRIGSLKSNIGHLLTGAGGAGLIKILHAFNTGTIPATIGIRESITSEDGRVNGDLIVQTPSQWPNRDSDPRRAAINVFGFGGTNAHMVVDAPGAALHLRSPETTPQPETDLAVIGMAGCFAGWRDMDALSTAFYRGRSGLRDVPPNRFSGLSPNHLAPIGGYLDGFEVDMLRFRMPPKELKNLNPQHLLTLDTADAALREAGIEPGSRVAVLVGMGHEPFIQRLQERWEAEPRLRRTLKEAGLDLPEDTVQALIDAVADGLHRKPEAGDFLGYVGNLLASRVAALWDFSGPAFSLSEEENSVFRAVQIAQMMLDAGEAEAVVVVGIDLTGTAEHLNLRARYATQAAAEGHPFGFDRNNKGWMPGEGAGALVLTKPEAARAQNRPIHACLSGMSLIDAPAQHPHDQAPAPIETDAALTEALRDTLAKAGLSSNDIGYVEAHASGIAAEDQAEITALKNVFAMERTGLKPALGSAKALLGHSMAASGIAALIHAVLAVRDRYLPPVPDWAGPKSAALADAGLWVTEQPIPWITGTDKVRAAIVTSLGLDGCVGSVAVVEEPVTLPVPLRVTSSTDLSPIVLPVTAPDLAGLQEGLRAVKTRLRQGEDPVRVAQEHSEMKSALALALVGEDAADLQQEADALEHALADYAARGKTWTSPRGSYFTGQPVGPASKIAFVYSGMNAVDVGMGRDLFRLLPEAIERLADYGDPAMILDTKLLYPPQAMGPGNAAEWDRAQARLQGSIADLLKLGVVLPTLSTRLLKSKLGLTPDIIFGYSLGELSMLHAAGHWPLSSSEFDALMHSDALARLMGPMEGVRAHFGLEKTNTVRWTSHVLLASAEEVRGRIGDYNRVFVTHINTPEETVIAGDPEQCAALIRDLNRDGVEIAAPLAIHCPPSFAEKDRLARVLGIPADTPPEPRALLSAADDREWTPEVLADWMATGFCTTVNFPAQIQSAHEAGARVFVELGPGASCTRWISETLGADKPYCAVSVSQRGLPEAQCLARLEAALVSHRVPLTKPLAKKAAHADRSRTIPIELGGPPITAKLRDPKLRQLLKQGLQNPSVPSQPPIPAPSPPLFDTRRDVIRALFANAWQQAATHDALLELAERMPLPSQGAARPSAPLHKPVSHAPVETPILDEAAVMEFAEGKISRVFGPNWADIDQYPLRLRLPSPPFTALSRVTLMEGTPNVLGPARIVTEYDVPENAWYGVDGQAPYMALDAQGILVLASWLGVDRLNQGLRHYRWLDATFTYYGDMPQAGETIAYDISLRRFSEAGDALLFYTDFDCSVSGRPMMTIRDCCAGFFTAEELKGGAGITEAHRSREPRSFPRNQAPLAVTRSVLDQQDLLALSRGQLEILTNTPSPGPQGLKLPPPAVQMIDRVTEIDTTGGAYGIGALYAEKDLDPTDWYIRSHFKDDPVYAGPCMLEGSRQTLQIFMLACGMDQQVTGPARFQPVLDVPVRVRFRGQVPGEVGVFGYRITIIGLENGPAPWVVADVEFIYNGRVIGLMEGLGMRIAQKEVQS
ncbi:beta-ketoacyl synthase N-terminal-like domain-containing protein [Rhodospirillum sp. A1_3_36]|uniref:beta-ketoacyl synthase N-terminal-like domain-containing protein n=1 Tax=Rhodospirillum sp. A1_3_36 TaxID=3391666 RepID=UPI0039A7497F